LASEFDADCKELRVDRVGSIEAGFVQIQKIRPEIRSKDYDLKLTVLLIKRIVGQLSSQFAKFYAQLHLEIPQHPDEDAVELVRDVHFTSLPNNVWTLWNF
jgi:hypothetical protein